MPYFPLVPPNMSIPFLKPKLDGARFAGHTVPLDVLKDWAALEDMIVEVAKDLFLQSTPGRTRIPKGFSDGFSLHLKGVEEGSAIMDLVRTGIAPSLLPCEDLFDRAKVVVLATIAAASMNLAIPDSFPRTALRHFDRFGRSLRGGECIYFTIPDHEMPIRFDLDVRKRLVLTTADEYSAERELRGWVSMADVEKRSFILKLPDCTHVPGVYQLGQRETVHSALGRFGEQKVRVKGTVVFDANDCPKKFETTDIVDFLNPHDLLGRLDDLLLVRDGWLDGEGVGPDPDGIRWLADLWPITMPSDIEDPYAYPSADGNLQLEWSLDRQDVSATINLSAKTGALMAQHLDNPEQWEEEEVDLNDTQGWVTFAEFLHRQTPTTNGLG